MKLTEKEIKLIVDELDLDVETEHRKGATFYATGFYEITEDDIEYLTEILNKDCTQLIGTAINSSGYWSDDNGCDWYEFWQTKKVTTEIPEKIVVVPAHTKISWVKL